MGVILTSHSQLSDVDTPQGRQTKWIPTIPRRVQDVILPLVDIIGFAEKVVALNDSGERTETRVLHAEPSALWDAGDRTGRLPPAIPFKFAVFVDYLTRQTNTKQPAKRSKSAQ